MKYSETAAGGIISVSVQELTNALPQSVLTAKEARMLSGMKELVCPAEAQALFEYDGIKFLVKAEAEGFLEGKYGEPGTIVEFFPPVRGKNADKCPAASEYSCLCGAVFAAARGNNSLKIRRVQLGENTVPPHCISGNKNSGNDTNQAYSVTENSIYADGSVSTVSSSFISESKIHADELNLRLYAALALVRRRAEYEIKRHNELLPALKKLKFPHSSLREGQRELIERTYTAARQGERLFAEAPTGIGKTVSVLYGAVRAMQDGSIRRIFYLTPKVSQRREAYAAAGKLNEAGAGLRVLMLVSKEDFCPIKKDGPFCCDGKHCPLMKEYESRLGAALDSLLEKHRGYPVKTVTETAVQAGICPYEFALDLSYYCDIIICDYNSVFDPQVTLRRYFVTGDCSDAMLLCDEAHNLPSRSRDSFSALLEERDLAEFSETAVLSKGLDSAFGLLCRAFDGLRGLCSDTLVKDSEGLESGYYFSAEPPHELSEAVDCIIPELINFRGAHREDAGLFTAASGMLRLCSKWQTAARNYDGHFRTYIEIKRGVLSAKLYCLDPSELLDATLSRVRASVFFSATLTPGDYFADILGGTENSSSLSLPSPFPPEKLFLGAVTSVDTRYEAREKSAKKICNAIAATVAAKKGNYIVFFPSYAYLGEVTKLFTEKYPKVRVRIQNPHMTRAQREDFLNFFEDDKGVLRIGFCVLGGSFSEGVDLPGGRLIGTVICGVGLPGISAENNIIREYYDTRSECGFDYAYTYPGMNSVLQAAGRVIRRETDMGAVVLIDDRYAEPRYKALMPPHWKKLRYFTDLHDLSASLAAFWAGNKE